MSLPIIEYRLFFNCKDGISRETDLTQSSDYRAIGDMSSFGESGFIFTYPDGVWEYIPPREIKSIRLVRLTPPERKVTHVRSKSRSSSYQ